MPCAEPIIAMLEPFRPVFTAPTWKKVLILLRGTVLARGRRTVTAALWYTGHDQDPKFAAPFISSLTEPAGLRCRRVGTYSDALSRPLSKGEAPWISSSTKPWNAGGARRSQKRRPLPR
jgi:hypothetical protein